MATHTHTYIYIYIYGLLSIIVPVGSREAAGGVHQEQHSSCEAKGCKLLA
jgi:hypothetical protein